MNILVPIKSVEVFQSSKPGYDDTYVKSALEYLLSV